MTPADPPTAAYPAAILLAGIFLSLALEQLARPHCPGLRRPFLSVLLHGSLLLLGWSVVLLVVRRPIFALLVVVAGQFLVIQVNNAKYRALREPFLFSDFGIFSQTIKHPRLYLPFLGIGRAVLIGLAICAAVAVGWWLESPQPQFGRWSLAAVAVGGALLAAGLALSPRLSLDPEKDIAQHGLFTTIARYWVREKTVPPPRRAKLPALRGAGRELPDIIVIQSESFFDPRRLFLGIHREILENFDEACASAACHGQLTVPAWGANTMRPEFSFLTGIDSCLLDVHRFNPYRQVARHPMRALPSVLREAGYKTACIHPHPARFFRRDRAFPNLDFERFADIREFRGATKAGPYISDAAVTDKLLREVEQSVGPTFIFVITMENHGPLHLERVSTSAAREFYAQDPPPGSEDLTVYLRHLRNADRALGRLRRALSGRTRPSVLCFYGEHLPSMPKSYDVLGTPDGRTDYFVEKFGGAGPATGQRKDLAVHELAAELLRAADLA